MKKYKKWLVWCSLFLLVFLLAGFFSYGDIESSREKELEKYSVILYQYTDNGWQSLSQGIWQAERDLNVDVNLITMAKEADVESQKELIDREVQNGAQGILVAAVDSQALKEKLEKVSKSIPVVTVETGVGDEITHIGANDYQMGYSLGEKILEDNGENMECRVAVIKEYMQRNSVQQRYNGLLDALKLDDRVKIVEWTRGVGDYDLALYLKTELSSWYEDAVVALDKYTMEALIDGQELKSTEAENLNVEVSRSLLYGIGNTEKIVNGLDVGEVQALVYQNEFNAGYQGVETLIQKKHKDFSGKSPVIKQQLVERETLYETENQRLLFPIL